jgi:hypothetical protein
VSFLLPCSFPLKNSQEQHGPNISQYIFPVFDCKLGDGTTIPCSELDYPKYLNAIQASTTALILRDPAGYSAALNSINIPATWIELGDYQIVRHIRWGDDVVLNFTGFPIRNTSVVVPNPKDIVTLGFGNVSAIRNNMAAAMLAIMSGYWNGGNIADPATVYSVPVFLLEQAVDSMAQVKQVGEKEQQAEQAKAKANFLQEIMAIVGFALIVCAGFPPHFLLVPSQP